MNPYLRNFCRRGSIFSVIALFIGLGLTASTLDARWSHPSITDHRSIVVIGDSLSDTGRTYSVIGMPPAPYYYEGRTSNGPLWVEYLAPSLGMDYNPSDNYAWAGANTGTLNVFPGLDGTGMINQLEEYLGGPPSPRWSRGLKTHVVFGGSNDFIRILSGGEDPFSVIPEAVVNIETIVKELHASGARRIVVVDLPDIGLTPRVRVAGPAASAQVTYLSQVFNGLLDSTLDALEFEVIRVSAFQLLNDLTNDPAAYGLTDVTTPGLYDPVTGDTHLFWDDIHPTTKVHALVAERVKEAIRAHQREQIRKAFAWFMTCHVSGRN